MSTPVTVSYGTFDFTTSFGSMPVPYLSRSQELIYAGKKWGQGTSLTLNGSIVGTSGIKAGQLHNYEALNYDRNKILYEFSRDFKSLQIKENGSLLTGFDYCKVNGVSFDAANQGKIDYSIELECYDKNTWITHEGVLDPVDEYTLSQTSATDVEITHKVSARGYNTGAAPLQTAINFVNARTGLHTWGASSRWVIPPAHAVGKTISKDVNRPNASYSVTETYVVQTGDIDLSRGGGSLDTGVPYIAGAIQEINTTFASGANQEFSTVSVDYTLQVGKEDSAAVLRAAIPHSGVLFSAAQSAMPGTVNSKLYLRPVSYSVEDLADTEHKIKINAEYTDNFIGQINNSSVTGAVYFDYKITYDTDSITNVSKFTIGGDFKSTKNVTNRKKYADISGYVYDTLAGNASKGLTGFLFDTLVLDSAIGFNAINGSILSTELGSWNPNPAMQSFNIRNNKLKGTISMEASYDNENFLQGFREASYIVDYTPSLYQFANKPSCNLNGLYGIYSLGVMNRQKITLAPTFKGGNYKIGSVDATLEDYEKLASPYVLNIYNFYKGEIPFSDAITEQESQNSKDAPHNEVAYSLQLSTSPTVDPWIQVTRQQISA